MAATTKTWVNNQAPSCEDSDLNGFKNENNNLILGSSQSLNTGDNQQTNKAISTYSAVGHYFTGGGVADAYTLTVPSPRIAPHELQEGILFRAIMPADNTGACTLNPFTLGVTPIKLQGGIDDPVATDIESSKESIFTYRTAPSPHFELSNPRTTPNIGIGIGQTWQDVTVSRSSGVQYTNTTGVPIGIALSFTNGSAATAGVNITVNGLNVLTPSTTSSTYAFTSNVIVPDGNTYTVTVTGTMSIDQWSELR